MIEKWFADSYRHYSRFFREWLEDLGQQYRESNLFVCYPFNLADRYSDPDDQEIALFAGLTVPKKWEQRPLFYNALQAMMGEHPAQWFDEKRFVTMAMGNEIVKKLPEAYVMKWEIARFFRHLYDLRTSVYTSRGRKKVSRSLEERIAGEAKSMRAPVSEAIIKLFPFLPIKSRNGAAEMLTWRLYSRSGIGLGLWGTGKEELPWIWDTACNKMQRELMDDYWPQIGTKEERAQLICPNAEDYFYIAHAFKYLKTVEPKKTKRLVNYYRCGLYTLIQTRCPKDWRRFLFPVNI